MAAAFRIKCPKCGEIVNIQADQACPKCGEALSTKNEGEIQIYRKGSPVGMAVGYGVYINGQPMGHIANKESVRLPLPYGTYTIHFTCGMTRRCKDATVTLSADAPVAYIKGAIKTGFWTNTMIVEIAKREDMPDME